VAATDATVFSIRGQAFRIPVAFRDTSGNLITAWTGAAATAYPDNGTGVSLTIAEAPTSSGVGYIDVPAAQMTASMTTVKATITNSNATAYIAPIYTIDLSEPVGAWDAQTIKKFEFILLDVAATLLNQQTIQGASNIVAKRDGTTKLSGTYIETDSSAVRGKLS
jgi:hypothetical protein